MSHKPGRRNFLGAALSSSFAASLFWRASARAQALPVAGAAAAQTLPGISGPGKFVSVQTPGVTTLAGALTGGVREFHLVAEPVTIMLPDMSDGMGMTGRPLNVWGYNGSMIGPTIEAIEGETVRITVKNNLPEPTTVHFHGIELPIEMDGVPDFSQDPIPPGGTFVYEFPLNQSGTYFYHPHYMTAKQVGLGMMGFFIIHPKTPTAAQIVDHDYSYFLHTWKVNCNRSRILT